MSGHSKWSTIKHKKGALDAKRGKLFSKIAKLIMNAARKGGGDPDMNLALRYAIDKGKAIGTISLTAEGGSVTVESLKAYEMTSTWKK